MISSLFEKVGKSTLRHLEYVGGITIQIGGAFGSLGQTLPLVGNRLRWRSAVRQMSAIGVEASPMVGIMALCTGFILAMQAASELHRFGAMNLVVDLVSIAFTRELGPLLAAIAVSGRSGSAFSAEIGSMVVTEEIDALRTMAIDPLEFLLAPKYLGTLIALPCLSILSNTCGILAGGLFMRFSTHMTFGVYLRDVFQAIILRDVITGLLKSVAFATIIVHVGCLEGFRVRGGPDAVGRSATSAVVKSTFLVILADVGFTALFYLIEGK
ncbi:MAG TPA: ABC transporter permease [Bryobacteraceae bacterium]|jgi:phospholipid/cholesterol/gamma-HCH transport system permease protein|nr:ABC transporter permease [Bryobacteraceae bacterium]